MNNKTKNLVEELSQIAPEYIRAFDATMKMEDILNRYLVLGFTDDQIREYLLLEVAKIDSVKAELIELFDSNSTHA